MARVDVLGGSVSRNDSHGDSVPSGSGQGKT